MKAAFSYTFSIIFCLHLALASTARAFDEPIYDKVNFSADGIFIQGQEKESLLRALAAIASNFSSQSKVDEDLKEKALAISLNLDPLHYLSRSAYRNLMRGETPDPVPSFTSLSAVSETLWTSASRMLKSPVEPEERKLASLLIDLSLLIHPDPPEKRILALAESTNGKPIPWDNFVMLQPSSSKSSSQSEFLMKEGKELLRAKKSEMASTLPDTKGMPEEAPTRPTVTTKTLPEFEPIEQSIPVVVKIIAIDEGFAGGTLSLNIRNPKGDVEMARFPFVGEELPENYPQLPILTEPDSIPMPGLRISPKLLTSEELSWPANTIGALNFQTTDALPAARRLCRVKPGPWIPVLLKTTLRNSPPNDQFAFIETSASSEEMESLLAAAAGLNKPYILFPEKNFEALVDYIQNSHALEKLFGSAIITYSDRDEALNFLSTETPQALINASIAFAEIKRASEKMTLSELSRYQSAQERLEAIVNQFKNHGSARAMLEYGLRPVSEKTEIIKSLDAITTAIEPFFELENRSVDSNGLQRKIETSDLMLSQIRTKIHADTRDYHGQAENLIDEAEIYLGLSNKDTSIATQRLSTIQSIISAMRAEKASIEASFAP